MRAYGRPDRSGRIRFGWLAPASAVVLLVVLIIAANVPTDGAVARAPRFGGLFTVAGSLDPLGPRDDDAGVATRGGLFPASAPAVLGDGSLLIADGEVVVRVTPDGRSRIVAGYRTPGCAGDDCARGPGGDGGPAVRARLSDPVAVAALPDGGFLIADDEAGVVRRVDAQGIITTVAGREMAASDPAAPVGVGGPAVDAVLGSPEALAVAPDGRFFIRAGTTIFGVDLAGRLGIVRVLQPSATKDQIAVQPDGGVLVLSSRVIERVAPDGQIVRIARLSFPAVGLVALSDGGALTVNTGARQVVRVASDGSLSTVLGPRAFRDFAGREPEEAVGIDPELTFVGLAASSAGLLVATDTAVLLAPVHPSARTMVRIVDSRTTGGRVRLRIHATVAGAATVMLHRLESRQTLARVVVPVSAGTHWVRLRGVRGRHGLFTVEAQLSTGTGVAADSVSLLLGPALPVRVVEDVMSNYDGRGGWPYTCRRMSVRRVDCWSGFGGNSCDSMLAVIAGPDGLLHGRDYRCAGERPRFRRDPHWSAPSSVIVPL
jgi:hypothetical protein